MDKSKLQKILVGLSNFDSGLPDAFKNVEKEMQKVANKLREDAEIRTVETAKKKIGELKEEIRKALESLFVSFGVLKFELGENEKKLTASLDIKVSSLKTTLGEIKTANTENLKILLEHIGKLRIEIREISQAQKDLPDFASQIGKAEEDIHDVVVALKETGEEEIEALSKQLQEKIDKYNGDFLELRKTVMSALSRHGGGNANRNILVAGNPSTLSRYTDLNLIAGTNVTLTYTNNDNLKTTNLTIAATGGSGTNRNISTVAVSSVVASVASTDYVIIANQGVLLTMPTAVGNTNLYTIKNTATSSVMVQGTGAETIDGSANIILTTQYTAVDLISDDANWNVT